MMIAPYAFKENEEWYILVPEGKRKDEDVPLELTAKAPKSVYDSYNMYIKHIKIRKYGIDNGDGTITIVG